MHLTILTLLYMRGDRQLERLRTSQRRLCARLHNKVNEADYVFASRQPA
jgi:hypothetical protein